MVNVDTTGEVEAQGFLNGQMDRQIDRQTDGLTFAILELLL